MSMSPQIYINQIIYSEETLRNSNKNFPVVDNMENLRPDWFEYWPIRNYFLINGLNEEFYYGFFSPKFSDKTSHTLSEIYEFVKNNLSYDVFLFSPMPDQSCFFLNVFEQQELYDNGFMNTMNHFCSFCNINNDIEKIVMSSNESVYSNYFVAKGLFWKEWLQITNILFQISESSKFSEYNFKTNYNGVERKVFIQERVASLILSIKKFKSISYKTFLKPWSASKLINYVNEAVLCDSLKISYKITDDIAYLNQFYRIRNNLIEDLSSTKDSNDYEIA